MSTSSSRALTISTQNKQHLDQPIQKLQKGRTKYRDPRQTNE